MRILAIESSGKAASLMVYGDGGPEAHAFQNRGFTHSQTLMPMLDSMLQNAGMTLGDMDYIAAARGPGSFTGLRIGLSLAKGLSFGSGLPVIGISSLEALANSIHAESGIICCCMDARRNELYNAIFKAGRDGPERLCADRAVPAAEIAGEIKNLPENLTKAIICIGDGANICYTCLEEIGVKAQLPGAEHMTQNALGVAKAAYRILSDQKTAADDMRDTAANPVYLRLSQAERERNSKNPIQGKE